MTKVFKTFWRMDQLLETVFSEKTGNEDDGAPSRRRQSLNLFRPFAHARDVQDVFAFAQGIRLPFVVADPHQPDTPLIFANEAFQALTGYTQDELVGRNCRFMQGPDTDPAAVAALRHALANHQEITLDILNYRKDGTPFWNALFITPLQDATGQVRYFCAYAQDVNERYAREAELRRALENRQALDADYQRVLANSTLHASQLQGLADATMAITAADGLQATVEEIAYHARQILGTDLAIATLFRLHAPQDFNQATHTFSGVDDVARSRFGSLLQSCLPYCRLVCEENRTLRLPVDHPPIDTPLLDGAGWLGVPLRGRQGNNLGLIQVFGTPGHRFSVTDEAVLIQLAQFAAVSLENARNEEYRQRLLDVIEQSPDFISLATPDGRSLFVNEAGRRLVGLDAAPDAQHTQVRDFFSPDDLPFIENHVLPEIYANGRWRGEFRFQHFTNHHPIPIEYNLFATKDKDDQFLGLATVSRDITEKKRQERSLSFLNEAGIRLSATLDVDTVIDTVMRLGLEAFADVCFFDTLHPKTGQVQDRLVRHRHADKQLGLEALESDQPQCWPLVDGIGPRFRDVQCVPRYTLDYFATFAHDPAHQRYIHQLDIASLVVVPVIIQDDLTAVLTLIIQRSSNRLINTQEAQLAEDLGRRAGIALLNAQLHQQVSEKNEQLSLAVEATRLGLWEFCFDTKAITCTPRCLEMLGVSPAQTVTQAEWNSRIHPEDRDHVLETLAQASRPGGDGLFSAEYRLVHDGGDAVWVFANGKVTFDMMGRHRVPVRMVGTLLDITERKQLEAVLIESEKQFRSLADSIPQLVWTANAEGEVTWYNRRWYDFTGIDPQDVTPDTWQSLHDPELLPAITERWQYSLRTGTPFHMVFPLRGATGQYRTFLTRVIPVRDAQGQVTRWFGTNTDVTELRLVQEQLRRSEERLSRLLNLSPIAIVEVTATGHVEFVNPAAETLLCCPRNTLEGRHYSEFVVMTPEGDVVPQEATPIARALRGETINHEEYLAHNFATNERRIVSAHAVPITSPDGQTEGVLVALTDVTERYEARRALAQSERDFRVLTEQIPQLVWSTTPEGVPDYVNHRWVAYTGFDTAKTSEDWPEVFHPDDLDRSVAAWFHTVESGENYQIEYRLKAKDGSYRWFLGQALPIRDEASGAIERWFGTCTDIDDIVQAREFLARGRDELEFQVRLRTQELEHANQQLRVEMEQRSRAEEALRQSQKMEAIGQLTGGLAHDFNNLLTVILGNVEMARTRTQDEPKLDRNLSQVMAAAERGRKLTQQLLAFSRRQKLEAKTLNLNEMVENLQEMVSKTLGANILFETRLAPDLWTTLIDPTQFELAVINVLVNARDAMEATGGGVVMIETANRELQEDDLPYYEGLSPGEYVELAISDNGCGMTPDILARVTEPFFTTKEMGKGTGLGLSQVYGFVRQSRGHLAIYSEPGVGTTLRLVFPAVQASEVHRPEAPPRSCTLTPHHRVLLVEDNHEVRELAQEILQDLGYDLMAAENAHEALHLIDQGHQFDLLFTDVAMPGGMNGISLAMEVRRRFPTVHVLLSTGFADEFVQSRIKTHFPVLQKPYRPQDLKLALEDALKIAAG